MIPLGLPSLPYATDRGSLVAEGDRLVLTQGAEARRMWLPLVLSWDKLRNRRLARWRRLTVSEKSKACPPGVAFAARIGWGPGDGLVVYRSLGRPVAARSSGTRRRPGSSSACSTRRGTVAPLLKVEDA